MYLLQWFGQEGHQNQNLLGRNLETTLNMMLQPGTGTQQEEREKLARNQNVNTVERRKSLVTFCPLTHIQQNQCWKMKK
jgi:hypothetical protein